MPYVRESAMVGGKEIIVETGKWAKQAGGSVVIRCGDSMVLVAASGSQQPREIDFMPLTCEYQEKFYSSGKIPGSFFRREGRSTNDEILVARLMDRPVRPLFPKGWFIDTQIIANVISFDKENATDVLAMTGASCALHISDLVWDGPLAGVRVGRIDGQFVANPTFAEREKSDIDIIVAASKDAIMMVEGEMHELQEDTIIDALLFAHQAVQPLIELQERLRAANGKEKRPFTKPVIDETLFARVKELAAERLATAYTTKDKKARREALSAVHVETRAALTAEGQPWFGKPKDVDAAFGKLQKKVARETTLKTRTRIDGRRPDEVRLITVETGVLPRAHGSALFTRGETQALVAVTLGTKYDEKKLDTLLGDQKKTFYMDYNFPPFSTGEVKPLRGQSRREVGHGFLAERSVEAIVPVYEDFPYTIRVVSDILESNGSSSMASVCGGSLALMDAGVPTKAPVAGIAMGLMKEGDDYVVLSDILGDEDHLGDMDFSARAGQARPPPHPRPHGRRDLGAARRGLDPRAAHRHDEHQAGQGPRHHRPRWQDDPRDPGADGRADRHQRQRHRVDRVGERARHRAGAGAHLGPHDGARGRPVLQRHRQEDRRDRRVRRDHPRHRRSPPHLRGREGAHPVCRGRPQRGR